jgi:hypothetical protein
MLNFPTLDELVVDSTRALGLSSDAIAVLMAKNAAVVTALAAALAVSKSEKKHKDEPIANDRMLTPNEAASLLRRKPRWIYRNADRLPFVKRVSAKSLLISETNLQKWLAATDRKR